MTQIGKSKSMLHKGMMSGMKIDKPMKMTGTMSLMGQTYQCDMTMTPQRK